MYYDFRNIGPMRLGVDFRGGTMHSNKSATSSAGGNNTTGLDNALLGVRGSFHTPISWLNPYAQISAGYARSNATLPIYTGLVTTTPLPRTEDNFLMYEGFVGLTIHIFPMIDLRPVELGIGNMNRFGSSSTEDGPSSIGVKSIGASVVFHLPSRSCGAKTVTEVGARWNSSVAFLDSPCRMKRSDSQTPKEKRPCLTCRKTRLA